MKTIILGAGPSGLGVAWGLVEKGHRDIIVIEKEKFVGGLSASVKIGENVVDFGPHRFSPEYPDLVEKVGKLLGKDWLEVSNDHAVAFNGRVYRYPPNLKDFLNFSTVVISLKVVLSFMWCRVKALFGKKQTEETFESIIVSRFGRALYEDVVKPMSWKVWGNPEHLDPQFARLRFSVPTIVQWWKKLVGHSDTFNDKVFYYPRKGFQQLWDVLCDHLKSHGVEIWTESQVSSIQTDEGRIVSVTVNRAGKEQVIAVRQLVSTIPTQNFTRLLRPIPVSSAELLGAKFHNRGMLLVYFLVKRPLSLPARVVIFPERKFLFNRLSEQNQFSRETVQEGHSVVLADVLADVGTDGWNVSDEELIRSCTGQIERLGFFYDEEVVDTKVLRIPVAYPLPTKARELEQAKFNSIFSQYENLICTGRFASTDYNNSHTAIRKGLMAAEAIHQKTLPEEWYRVAEEVRKTAIRD